METLPADWFALMAVVFAFGLKHGLDADHLAAIDGLTRINGPRHPRLARWCGSLFSLGHGAVVLAIAAAVGGAAARFEVPQWLNDTGAWISIAVLTMLGLMNLVAVVTTPADQVVAPLGLRSRLFRLDAQRPLAVAAVGALFALSFDTVSQAALFALAAAHFGGLGHALLLGASFTLGMLIADGLNGLWISRLLRRADRAARIASRVMGVVVALTSLAVAALGAAKYLSPAVAAWSEGRELVFGGALLAMIAVSYLATRRLARVPRLALR